MEAASAAGTRTLLSSLRAMDHPDSFMAQAVANICTTVCRPLEQCSSLSSISKTHCSPAPRACACRRTPCTFCGARLGVVSFSKLAAEKRGKWHKVREKIPLHAPAPSAQAQPPQQRTLLAHVHSALCCAVPCSADSLPLQAQTSQRMRSSRVARTHAAAFCQRAQPQRALNRPHSLAV